MKKEPKRALIGPLCVLDDKDGVAPLAGLDKFLRERPELRFSTQFMRKLGGRTDAAQSLEYWTIGCVTKLASDANAKRRASSGQRVAELGEKPALSRSGIARQ